MELLKHSTERMLVLDVQAFDWNCPQHITPCYTSQEIELAFASQRQHVYSLETENKYLKDELNALKKH